MRTLLLILVAVCGLVCAIKAQSLPGYVAKNGLVGWWPFSGNAQDQSGNGNHGVVTGAGLDMDRFGNTDRAYYFNGTNSAITVESLSTSFANGLTVSLWCKLVQGTGNAQFLVARSNDNQAGHFHVQYNQLAFARQFAGGINTWKMTPAVKSSCTFPAPHSNWHHVVYTFNNAHPSSSYQWQVDSGKGFKNIDNTGQYSGTASKTLVVSKTSWANHLQRFRCIVTHGCDSEISDAVQLHIFARV